jgi:ParB/RepB/Spo0J family partition protein
VLEQLRQPRSSRDASRSPAWGLLFVAGMRDIRRRPLLSTADDGETKYVPLGLIEECDSLRLRERPYFGIDELAEDIRIRGQTSALFVYPMNDLYKLISGYRRKAALEKIGAEQALVRIFRTIDDEQAYDLAVSENQARDALTDMERATVCLNLQNQGRTIDQIAKAMGWKADSHVYRHLRIAREAPPLLRMELQARRMHLNAAIVFLDEALKLSEDQQRDALSLFNEQELSAGEFRRHLKRIRGNASEASRTTDAIRDLKDGGFVVKATRFEPDDPEGVERSIDVLQSALKKARSLKRRIDSKAPTEVTE